MYKIIYTNYIIILILIIINSLKLFKQYASKYFFHKL